MEQCWSTFSNPFANFQCFYKKVKREFLDQDELNELYKTGGIVLAKRLCKLLGIYYFSEAKNAGRAFPRQVKNILTLQNEKFLVVRSSSGYFT
jgi:hypothetical protein